MSTDTASPKKTAYYLNKNAVLEFLNMYTQQDWANLIGKSRNDFQLKKADARDVIRITPTSVKVNSINQDRSLFPATEELPKNISDNVFVNERFILGNRSNLNLTVQIGRMSLESKADKYGTLLPEDAYYIYSSDWGRTPAEQQKKLEKWLEKNGRPFPVDLKISNNNVISFMRMHIQRKQELQNQKLQAVTAHPASVPENVVNNIVQELPVKAAEPALNEEFKKAFDFLANLPANGHKSIHHLNKGISQIEILYMRVLQKSLAEQGKDYVELGDLYNIQNESERAQGNRLITELHMSGFLSKDTKPSRARYKIVKKPSRDNDIIKRIMLGSNVFKNNPDSAVVQDVPVNGIQLNPVEDTSIPVVIEQPVMLEPVLETASIETRTDHKPVPDMDVSPAVSGETVTEVQQTEPVTVVLPENGNNKTIVNLTEPVMNKNNSKENDIRDMALGLSKLALVDKPPPENLKQYRKIEEDVSLYYKMQLENEGSFTIRSWGLDAKSQDYRNVSVRLLDLHTKGYLSKEKPKAGPFQYRVVRTFTNDPERIEQVMRSMWDHEATPAPVEADNIVVPQQAEIAPAQQEETVPETQIVEAANTEQALEVVADKTPVTWNDLINQSDNGSQADAAPVEQTVAASDDVQAEPEAEQTVSENQIIEQDNSIQTVVGTQQESTKEVSSMRTNFNMELTANKFMPFNLLADGENDQIKVSRYTGPTQIYKGPDWIEEGPDVSVMTITFKDSNAKIHIEPIDINIENGAMKATFSEPKDMVFNQGYDNLKEALEFKPQQLEASTEELSPFEQKYRELRQSTSELIEQLTIVDALKELSKGFNPKVS